MINNTSRQKLYFFLQPKTTKDFDVLKTNLLLTFFLYVRITKCPKLKVKKWPFSPIFETIYHEQRMFFLNPLTYRLVVVFIFNFHFESSLTNFYSLGCSTLSIFSFKKYFILHRTYSVLRLKYYISQKKNWFRIIKDVNKL